MGKTLLEKLKKFQDLYEKTGVKVAHTKLIEIRTSSNTPTKYFFAFMMVMISLAIKYLLNSALGVSAPFLLAFTAVLVSAIFGGFGPGLFATLYAGLLVDYYFIPPVDSFFGVDKSLQVVVFLIEGILLSSINWTNSRYEDTIQHQSFYDQVTNLPNRRHFQQRLEMAQSQADEMRTQFAVLFLDMDMFKNVNDMLGHRVGDMLLIKFGQRLEKIAGSKNFVARFGGDEFVILLPYVQSQQSVIDLSEKLIRSFEDVFVLKDYSLYATASIGAAIYPDDSKDLDSLLKDANATVHLAKESGRNSYKVFSDIKNLAVNPRLHLAKILPEAIRKQQFYIDYQPIIDIKTGEIKSAEALLRWKHPEFGLIPPDEFIPVAEKTGNIFVLGEWVLKNACKQLKLWHGEHLPKFKISVNVSVHQLSQNKFVDKVKKILQETQLEPQYLELEITEGVVLYDYLMKTLHELSDLGVGLVLDDFGAGYSSLGHLRSVPIKVLKIDRSFIKGCQNSPQDCAVIKAMVQLSKSMGFEVVAEGVDNPEQISILRDLGCHLIQGHFLSRPLSPRRLAIDVHDQFKFLRQIKKAA